MSDDWDFYSCRVDDEPASIFVDLGIRRDAPLSDRPYMAYVRLFMRSPRPDGLSSHWAYFPDEESRGRFLRAVASLGFEVRELQRSDDLDRPFGAQFSRIDLPSFEAIDSVTLPLHRAAIEAGGDYDGWETQVIS